MAENKNSANGTSKKTVAEMKAWYEANAKNIENFAKAQSTLHNLRDVTKTNARTVTTINKEQLKAYIKNIGANEKNLRIVARYLYYRSHLYFRLVAWYANMWDLNCRKVVPTYDLVKSGDPAKMLKQYNDTLDALDRFSMQDNMVEVFTNIYVDDVYFGIRYTDDYGTFFYRLEPDECQISGRYSGGDLAYNVDMSKWRSAARQQVIEYLGEPLASMYRAYETTNEKMQPMPDEYCVCFKFRTDILDLAIPPLLGLFLQIAALEDLVDIQADADELNIYKLIYLPMKVHTNSNNVDDFLIDPSISKKYFDKIVSEEVIPRNVGAALVPGDELKTIDFAKSVDGDVNSVEKSQNQIMGLAGGGAVLNANNITSTAAFEAWLESETQFALSTLIGQINAAVNRWLSYETNNPAKVAFFEVSVYTKKKLAEQLLDSCKYSFSNRLAYNTLIGISEKETLAMEFFETQVLKLPELMNHPLTSSYTQSGKDSVESEVGQGRPQKDSGDLSDSGERSRNR